MSHKIVKKKRRWRYCLVWWVKNSFEHHSGHFDFSTWSLKIYSQQWIARNIAKCHHSTANFTYSPCNCCFWWTFVFTSETDKDISTVYNDTGEADGTCITINWAVEPDVADSLDYSTLLASFAGVKSRKVAFKWLINQTPVGENREIDDWRQYFYSFTFSLRY